MPATGCLRFIRPVLKASFPDGQVWLAPRAAWHHGTMIPDCSQSSSAKSLGKVKQGLRWNGLLLLKNTI